jgi:uncharacterized heparinase superfamily protein
MMTRLKRGVLRARLAFARGYIGRFGYRASRFLYVPPHLHLADPSVAADFLAGQVVLAGRSLLASGRPIFDMPVPSRDFAVALHGFDWLRHFDASGNAATRAGANRLIRMWLGRRESGAIPDAELPEAIPRRVIAWVTHSALITEEIDYSAYRRLLAHLARDASMLRVFAGSSSVGMLRLESAIALGFHALALNRSAGAIDEAQELILFALDDCIADDGGPRNRDAGTAVRLASSLIPLLALYRARQRPAPDAIGLSLLRLVGFARMMQHPDGGLALFNGAGLVSRDLVAQVTRFGSGKVARRDSAPETGFERLENEHGILIADTGRLPYLPFARAAGAGALAFEFSSKSDRIIVNCGRPPSAEGEVARSLRTAAAHASLMIEDEPLVRIEPYPMAVDPHAHVTVSDGRWMEPHRHKTEAAETLRLGHTGLNASHGFDVERILMLRADGGLAGIDRFIDVSAKGADRRVTLAFHLHARIMPVPLSRQDAIVLRLPHQTPGRDMWLFEAPGLALRLEASRFFGEDIVSPRTEAIVLEAIITGSSDIRWRLVPYTGPI